MLPVGPVVNLYLAIVKHARCVWRRTVYNPTGAVFVKRRPHPAGWLAGSVFFCLYVPLNMQSFSSYSPATAADAVGKGAVGKEGVRVSRDGNASFCSLVRAHVESLREQAGGSRSFKPSEPSEPCNSFEAGFEIEYRTTISNTDMWTNIVTALRSVPDARVQQKTYCVVNFPSDVRATLSVAPASAAGASSASETPSASAAGAASASETPTACAAIAADNNDPLIEQKTSIVRVRVGDVGGAPLWGVFSTERLLTVQEALPYAEALQTFVDGDVDLSRATLTSPHTVKWLRGARTELRFKRARNGSAEQYLSLAGIANGEHVAFGGVRAPSRVQTAGGGVQAAWCTPTSARECTRTSFQWDRLYRVDCTTMRVNNGPPSYHLEVECTGSEPVAFPAQIEDLLRRHYSTTMP